MMSTKNAMLSWSALACSAPVRTCVVEGSSGSIASSSLACETPLAAETEMASKPSLSSRRWAVGTSKIANVAPPSESRSPYLAMPVIRKGSTGPLAATRTVSPTPNCSFPAVSLSITTSPGPEAQAPSTRLSGLNCS